MLVLAGMGAGLLVVAAGRFRAGTVLFALSVSAAALLRALLPERSAGLLAVRTRLLDVLTLALLAAALSVLAVAVPPPP